MGKALLITATGVVGILLVLCAYILLWISPDTGIAEVIVRTRGAIIINFSGSLMIFYYLYKK
jgi:hypothetical protein